MHTEPPCFKYGAPHDQIRKFSAVNFSERLVGFSDTRRTCHHRGLFTTSFSERCLGDSLKLGNQSNGALFFVIAELEPVPPQPILP